MKTLTMCGSMRFEKDMQTVSFELETKHGYNVLQCVYAPKDAVLSDAELRSLENTHYKKIDISDGIYVLNIDGYIGNSVLSEIQYARKTGKEVIYHINSGGFENEKPV